LRARRKEKEMVVGDKLEFLSVHAPHIHEENTKMKLRQP